MTTKGNEPIRVRVDADTRARWTAAAGGDGMLSAFVRESVEMRLLGNPAQPVRDAKPKTQPTPTFVPSTRPAAGDLSGWKPDFKPAKKK
jgi:hypothetical protein